jgi:hypothetical protein
LEKGLGTFFGGKTLDKNPEYKAEDEGITDNEEDDFVVDFPLGWIEIEIRKK